MFSREPSTAKAEIKTGAKCHNHTINTNVTTEVNMQIIFEVSWRLLNSGNIFNVLILGDSCEGNHMFFNIIREYSAVS